MLIVRDRVVELVHRPASHSPPQACIDRRRRHLLPWRDRASGRRSVLHNKTRWFLDNGGARVSERSWPTALTGPRTWVAWVETGLCQWGRFTTVDARCMTVAICDDSCWLQLRQYCCNSIYDNYIMHNALHFLSGFSTWNVCTRIVAHHFPSTFELSESDNWDNGNNIHMYCD